MLIEDGWNGSAAAELIVVDMVASCGDLGPGQVGARRQPDETVDSHDATPTPSTASGRGGMMQGLGRMLFDTPGARKTRTAPRGAKMGCMRYVLLTWNPGPSDDEQFTPEQWLEKMVIPLREGRLPDGDRWSVGTNWKTIEVGDLACMFRQGVHGRGIVAVGVITRSPFLDEHWDLDKTGDAWYVNVAWNRALDLNQMINVDELEREVPGFAWRQVYSSGRVIDGSAAEDLAALLGHAPLPPKKRGQQFGSPEHNRLVELEAMRLATRGYEAENYVVQDVSKQNLGWDLEARRGDTVFYIEVKGTTGPLPEFFLTPNEHRAASRQPSWAAVVITEVFSTHPGWFEISGSDVTAAAKPTQYRVSMGG